jgi:hypothetical protein
MECALVAQKTTRSDHAAQMLAVGRLKHLLLLAQKRPCAGGWSGQVTYQEFELMQRRKNLNPSPRRKRRLVASGTPQGRRSPPTR